MSKDDVLYNLMGQLANYVDTGEYNETSKDDWNALCEDVKREFGFNYFKHREKLLREALAGAESDVQVLPKSQKPKQNY